MRHKPQVVPNYYLRKLRRNFTLLAVSAMVLTLVGISPHISATENIVVTVHVDGQRQVVATNANTVSEVLSRANIELNEADVVEPSIDAEITNHSFNVNIYRARPVVLIDGDEAHRIDTAHRSPRLIADRAEEVEIYEEDRLESELVTDFLDSDYVGVHITIERAMPVQVTIANKDTQIRTHAATVGEMFSEADIEIGEDDIVRPSLQTPITEGMRVTLTQVGFETETEEERIAPETERIYDNNRPVGYEKVEAEGEAGAALVTYRVEYRNGERVGREEVRRIVEKKSTPRRIVIGNKTSYSPGDNRRIGQQMAASRGWTGSQWNCLEQLWSRESGWNNHAQNPVSTAYGIAQFLDSTWSNYGFTKTADPAGQIEAGMAYITARYQTPCGAWGHFQSNNWY